jgi:hypothetical protein
MDTASSDTLEFGALKVRISLLEREFGVSNPLNVKYRDFLQYELANAYQRYNVLLAEAREIKLMVAV